MIVHQQHNSLGNHTYNAFIYKNCEWFYHFHKNYELIYIFSGEVELTLDDKSYLLTQDTFALILPNEFHAYHTPESSLAWVGVFSADFVSEFDKLTQNKRASVPIFSCEKHIRDYLLKYLITEKTPDTLLLKSTLYACCREFANKVSLRDTKNENSFIGGILAYISENFREEITLATAAEALGYEYHYLSRRFHNHFHVNFKQFLNIYRADFAREQLIHTDAEITEIAYLSGFQTTRTFDRVFREQTGMTPSAFRNSNRPPKNMRSRELSEAADGVISNPTRKNHTEKD